MFSAWRKKQPHRPSVGWVTAVEAAAGSWRHLLSVVFKWCQCHTFLYFCICDLNAVYLYAIGVQVFIYNLLWAIFKWFNIIHFWCLYRASHLSMQCICDVIIVHSVDARDVNTMHLILIWFWCSPFVMLLWCDEFCTANIIFLTFMDTG